MDLPGAAQRGQLQHILGAGRHLLGLITELLDIARIEADQLDLSTQPVPVRAAIEGTGLGLALSKRLTEAMGGRIVVESSPEGSRFWIALPLDSPCAAPDPASAIAMAMALASATYSASRTTLPTRR